MRSGTILAAGAVLVGSMFAASDLRASSITYDILANGIKEVNASGVPNGDADATAVGTIRLDNGTGAGNTGSAVINLAVRNVDGTLSGHHIHQAPATTTGSIVVDFGNPSTILTGTGQNGTLSGTITGLPAATISSVFANPTGFYYNLHSTPNFAGGAVRDQLPEPGSAALVALGALGLLARRRRRA
jgi:hypothetical protein